MIGIGSGKFISFSRGSSLRLTDSRLVKSRRRRASITACRRSGLAHEPEPPLQDLWSVNRFPIDPNFT